MANPEKEAVRQEINAWIRTSAVFDAVTDFHSVLRDVVTELVVRHVLVGGLAAGPGDARATA